MHPPIAQAAKMFEEMDSRGNAGLNQEGGNLSHWLARQLPDALDVPIRRSPGAGKRGAPPGSGGAEPTMGELSIAAC